MMTNMKCNNITGFTLDGKSREFVQLIPEKNTQVFTMFGGSMRPRVTRLMMLNLTAVLVVCRRSDVKVLNVGTIWQATS